VTYLIDTNVLAELRRRRPNAGVTRWLDSVSAAELHLSALVLGEVRQGVERLRPKDPDRAREIERWLVTLADDYGERVVPVTAQVADAWGRLNARGPFPVVDGLMAATAQVHGWTLVTRNTRDVVRTGVPLLDPFD
jgi:toxin FitB